MNDGDVTKRNVEPMSYCEPAFTVEGVHGSLVRVYDSLYTTNTKLQISAMTKPTSRSISIEIQKMHRQTNAVDCGLYAIAYATELCYGNNPASYV